MGRLGYSAVCSVSTSTETEPTRHTAAQLNAVATLPPKRLPAVAESCISALPPFPHIRKCCQNGPERSRARRFCAAKRTLDGEDPRLTCLDFHYQPSLRRSRLHIVSDSPLEPSLASRQPEARGYEPVARA